MTKAITEALAVIGEADASPPESDFVRIPIDLNKSLGGRYIYLCFKRGDGPPITDFRVKVGKNASPDPGYQHVPGYDATALQFRDRQDLNESVGGEYIYLTYSRAPGTPVVDLILQMWSLPSPAPDPPRDERGNRYLRIEGDLSTSVRRLGTYEPSGILFIKAAQLKRQPDDEPPDFHIDTGPMLAAYRHEQQWEISRAQVGVDRVAVRVLTVEGRTISMSADAPTTHEFTVHEGMDRSQAETIVREWNLKLGGAFNWKAFSMAVDQTVGVSRTVSTTFTSTEWEEEKITIAPDPRGGWRTYYFVEVVDYLHTYRLGGGAPLTTAVSYPHIFATFDQAGTQPTLTGPSPMAVRSPQPS